MFSRGSVYRVGYCDGELEGSECRVWSGGGGLGFYFFFKRKDVLEEGYLFCIGGRELFSCLRNGGYLRGDIF